MDEMATKEWNLIIEALDALRTMRECDVDTLDDGNFQGMYEADICRQIADLCQTIRDAK